MASLPIQYSLVIPLYNEAQRIPKTIEHIFAFAGQFSAPCEVIFVNDGSTDSTLSVLEGYRARYSFLIESYVENHGKGYAVRVGAKAARGAWIVFFDIDLATPIETLSELHSSLTGTDAVVIGSRRANGAKIAQSESLLRVFLGQGFTRLSNVLVPGVTDFTCGFKCFSAAARDIIFSRARIDRWGFDTELLYIAHLHKLAIRELPVVWSHDADSRVSVFKAVLSSAKELFQMWSYCIRGLYK